MVAIAIVVALIGLAVALIKIAPGILWFLLAAGALVWIVTTLGGSFTILIAIGLVVLWLLFRK